MSNSDYIPNRDFVDAVLRGEEVQWRWKRGPALVPDEWADMGSRVQQITTLIDTHLSNAEREYRIKPASLWHFVPIVYSANAPLERQGLIFGPSFNNASEAEDHIHSDEYDTTDYLVGVMTIELDPETLQPRSCKTEVRSNWPHIKGEA